MNTNTNLYELENIKYVKCRCESYKRKTIPLYYNGEWMEGSCAKEKTLQKNHWINENLFKITKWKKDCDNKSHRQAANIKFNAHQINESILGDVLVCWLQSFFSLFLHPSSCRLVVVLHSWVPKWMIYTDKRFSLVCVV